MSQPKKSLGQHWLHDPAALTAIADAAEISQNDNVFEIGPGLGTLTKLLVQRAERVYALEIDAALVESLPSFDNLVVTNDDFRSFNLESLPQGYKTVANVPYYLTGLILRRLSESANPPILMTVLVQKEVAERIAAGPGNLSILSLSMQLYGHIRLGRVVEAALFEPPPKVDSQIVTIKAHNQYSDEQKKAVLRLVKIGFSAKRKTLLNNLAAGLRTDKPTALNVLTGHGLHEKTRAQEVPLDTWLKLVETLAI